MIDESKLKELVSGDGELLKTLVDLFKSDLPILLKQIEKGLASENIEDVCYAAHRLKGQLRNFFEDHVSMYLELIESYGKNVDRERAEEALVQVNLSLPDVIRDLDRLIRSDKFD